MPHLNDDIDLNLRENNLVTCLIVRNKLNEPGYKNMNIKKNQFLFLSFKNSLIKNAKQHFISIEDQSTKIPYILGMNYSAETNKWIDNTKDIMLKNSSLMNESILKNLCNELKINEFETIINGDEEHFFSQKKNESSGFSFEK
jgi:hypothetical protein